MDEKIEVRSLRGLEDDPKARVVVEQAELEIKILKLEQFMASGMAEEIGLSREMTITMRDQLDVMRDYNSLLLHRIKIWGMTDEEIEEAWKRGTI